ncbi:N-formylglutamate deformylase [Acidiphilium sp. AL]|uniref:N-formylglutamate deformylase n=1 Tax=Acidiphilium sp. AL TaxID=2871704 RepID=UPI0021CB1330|nr:N-formylglutamate deformylase [Acidiphilium sp. AL]MCU4159978.1 N-formylglutamate deformylase [Acidiphilium sp. AL]
MTGTDFITVRPGNSRLILSLPHTGTDIPDDLAPRFVSRWQTLADADWWLEKLYDFAEDRDVTIIRTTMSRSVIDVNRVPSGVSLYPGMATTSLCPLTDFDGAPLYNEGQEPDDAEIARRRVRYFEPYHAILAREIARLRDSHDQIVLFDAHSIRSRIPRLFDGLLPVCNIGTNGGVTASPALVAEIVALCAASPFDHIVNGRFKGGYITRHYAAPEAGVHTVQLELACRAYIDEPEDAITESNWPPPYSSDRARTIRDLLIPIIGACLDFPIVRRPGDTSC